MKHVLTLICDPRIACLNLDMAQLIAAELPDAQEPVWLAEHIALDIAFDARADTSLERVQQHCRQHIQRAPVDLAVHALEHRRKRLLIADMDSTIIGQECIDELGVAAGLGDKIAAITERAMRGEIDFEDALKERVASLKGLPVATLTRVLDEKITLTRGAQTLVATMRAQGAICALVSGGFSHFSDAIAKAAGFEHVQANELVIENGALTGAVQAPILGKEAKAQALLDLCREHNIAPEHALAVGDGANDLDMISQAGMGVAFHAKPVVAKAAQFRIDHGDLTGLLYLQGYSADQFAEPQA